MWKKGSIPGDKREEKRTYNCVVPCDCVVTCNTYLFLDPYYIEHTTEELLGQNMSIGKPCTKRRKGWEWRTGGRCVIRTCRLYKLWVGIIRDEWNWQIPEVQFKCTSDNIDIFIHIHRNISFLPICVEKALTLKPWKCREVKYHSKQK